MGDDAARAFKTKLASLNVSVQSIETLSHWCIFHRKNATQLATTWMECLERAPSKQKLAFLYLASDVAQNGRKKGPEWADALVNLLPEACRRVVAEGDEQTMEKVKKLLRVWSERRVFSGSDVESWLDGVSGGEGDAGSKPAAAAAPAAAKPTAAAKKKKNDMAELPALSGENAVVAKLLMKMEKAERDLAAANERFDADVRDEFLDESTVENAADPSATLRSVQKCESAILAKRDATDAMSETLSELENKLRAALTRVEEVREAQSGADVGALTQMMLKALKTRKKASKRNAEYICERINGTGVARTGGDAPLPEPVDFDAQDDDNYDPTDAPEEYVPSDNKRQKL